MPLLGLENVLESFTSTTLAVCFVLAIWTLKKLCRLNNSITNPTVLRIVEVAQFSKCPDGKNKANRKVVEVGDSSMSSRPKSGTGKGQQPAPPCVKNPDFPDQLAKWAKRNQRFGIEPVADSSND
ncbi:hypothetical protein Q3G72_018459 [Acer saccharum]|nr:hypothetical protein Q3G72_018459 [Acer saccharum]